MFMNENETKSEETKLKKRTPYEIGFLVSGKLTQEDAETFATRLTSAIQENTDGIINEGGRLKRRKLAYPVNGEANAYFGVVNFDAVGGGISTLREKLKLEQSLLRYLIVSVDPRKLTPLRPFPYPGKPVEREEEKKPKEEIKMKELEKKLEEIIEG